MNSTLVRNSTSFVAIIGPYAQTRFSLNPSTDEGLDLGRKMPFRSTSFDKIIGSGERPNAESIALSAFGRK